MQKDVKKQSDSPTLSAMPPPVKYIEMPQLETGVPGVVSAVIKFKIWYPSKTKRNEGSVKYCQLFGRFCASIKLNLLQFIDTNIEMSLPLHRAFCVICYNCSR